MIWRTSFLVVVVCMLLSCESEPKKLTPRMMKEVDQQFRKVKKEMQEEMDSLCILYQEKHLVETVDSIVELRMLQDKQNRIHIDE